MIFSFSAFGRFDKDFYNMIIFKVATFKNPTLKLFFKISNFEFLKINSKKKRSGACPGTGNDDVRYNSLSWNGQIEW